MTMTALPPAPAAPVAPASGSASSGSASGTGVDGAFAALVALSLDAQAGGEPTAEGAAAGTIAPMPADVANLAVEDAPADDLEQPAADTDADPTAAAAALLVPAQTIAVVAQLATSGKPAAVTGQPETDPSGAAVSVEATGGATTAAGDPVGGNADAPLPTSAKDAPATAVGPAADARALPPGAAAAGVDMADLSPAGSATHKATAATDSAVPTAAASPSQTSAPVSGPASLAASAAAPSAPVSPAAVTSQVFPEVARLVTRGDGTQRITLRLTPDNLGEVKVLLTVRDGAVQVTLSGGQHAQEALRSGSHELHRLLEMVGANSSQIKVADLSGGTATSTSDFGADDRGSGQSFSDGNTGERRTPGSFAGSPRSTPGAASLLDSTNPGTSAPVSGVDVRM